MNQDLRRQAIALYDRFTHEGLGRRDFMTRMAALAGGAAAAEALVGAIAASPAAAAIAPADDPRLTTRTQLFHIAGLPPYPAYIAEPRSRSLKPSVIVVHENRGLNDHIRDMARHLALSGYRAVAPDFLAPAGGTPVNEDEARARIAKLDLAQATNAGRAILNQLAASSRGRKVGMIGFCWGGAYVNRFAVAADSLAAGVVYYGPAPDPAEAVKVAAPLMFHLAERDDRVAATAWPWIKALRAAGKPVTAYNYLSTDHAFNNNTSAERYDKPAAELAWRRTISFFRRHLR